MTTTIEDDYYDLKDFKTEGLPTKKAKAKTKVNAYTWGKMAQNKAANGDCRK